MPEPEQCIINNRIFLIFGSLFSFYAPMIFIVIAHVRSIWLLNDRAWDMKEMEFFRR